VRAPSFFIEREKSLFYGFRDPEGSEMVAERGFTQARPRQKRH